MVVCVNFKISRCVNAHPYLHVHLPLPLTTTTIDHTPPTTTINDHHQTFTTHRHYYRPPPPPSSPFTHFWSLPTPLTIYLWPPIVHLQPLLPPPTTISNTLHYHHHRLPSPKHHLPQQHLYCRPLQSPSVTLQSPPPAINYLFWLFYLPSMTDQCYDNPVPQLPLFTTITKIILIK